MSKNVKTFRLNNLSAGVNTISEDNALASFDFNGQGIGAEARVQENWAPFNRGGLRKARGFSLHKAVSANRITGLYRFVLASGTSHFLVSSGTSLQHLAGGVLTNIYTSLTSGNPVTFETALNKVVYCDGTIVPRTWDGTTEAALATGADATPITGSKQALFYQNRLWLFGNTSNPSLLYYSNPGDIAAGYATQFVQCDANDGQRITGIDKFFIPGSLEPIIVVGKERSIGIVTGDGSTANPYTFSKINADAGIPGIRQIVQFGQDIAYLTSKGVSSFRTDNQDVNLAYRYLSEKVRDQFQDLNQSNLGRSLAWYDWKNSRISFAVPEAGQGYPNVLWHYDIRLGAFYTERWGGSYDCTAAFVDTDGTLYHGDSSGNLYIHQATDHSWDGDPIAATYTTPYLDFGAPHLYKRILAARATIRGQGTYTLGVSASYDYGSRTGGTNTLNLNTGSYTWNGGTWTSNPLTYQWGGNPIRVVKFHPSGHFRAVQFTFLQTGADQPADLFEVSFDVEFSSLI